MKRNREEHRARLREKGQVTIPNELRAELDLHEGDELTICINDRGNASL